jgi:hypothetical protein
LRSLPRLEGCRNSARFPTVLTEDESLTTKRFSQPGSPAAPLSCHYVPVQSAAKISEGDISFPNSSKG